MPPVSPSDRCSPVGAPTAVWPSAQAQGAVTPSPSKKPSHMKSLCRRVEGTHDAAHVASSRTTDQVGPTTRTSRRYDGTRALSASDELRRPARRRAESAARRRGRASLNLTFRPLFRLPLLSASSSSPSPFLLLLSRRLPVSSFLLLVAHAPCPPLPALARLLLGGLGAPAPDDALKPHTTPDHHREHRKRERHAARPPHRPSRRRRRRRRRRRGRLRRRRRRRPRRQQSRRSADQLPMGSTHPAPAAPRLAQHARRAHDPRPPTSPPSACLGEILQLPDRMQRKVAATRRSNTRSRRSRRPRSAVRLREDLEAARHPSDAFETAVHELAADVDTAGRRREA